MSNRPVDNLLDPRVALSEALLVDYDSDTGEFSHWTSFRYTDPVTGYSGITHFEGISGVEPGKYRRPDGSFGDLLWTPMDPPVSGGAPFADSVYGNAVVGIALTSSGVNAHQAVVVPST